MKSAITFLFSLFLVTGSGFADGIVDSLEGDPAGAASLNSGEAAGQSFEISNSAYALDRISLPLAKEVGDPDGVAEVLLTEDLNGSPGDVIRSWPNQQISSDSSSVFAVTVDDEVMLEANTRYWVVVRHLSGGRVLWPTTQDAPTGNGQILARKTGIYPDFPTTGTERHLVRVEGDVQGPVVRLTDFSASLPEGDSGPTSFVYTLTRSGALNPVVEIDYNVFGKPLIPGASYSSASPQDFGQPRFEPFPSGMVEFASGETTKTITLNVIGDTDFEFSEGFDLDVISSDQDVFIDIERPIGGVIENDDAKNAVHYVIFEPGLTPFTVPFVTENNTVSALLPHVPPGAEIGVHNLDQPGSPFVASNSFATAWSNPSMTLSPGEGFVFRNPTDKNVVLKIEGTVIESVHKDLDAGTSLIASQVYRSGLLVADLGFPVAESDIIQIFDSENETFEQFEYRVDPGSPPEAPVMEWFPEEPAIQFGQPFYFQSGSQDSRIWSQNYPGPILPFDLEFTLGGVVTTPGALGMLVADVGRDGFESITRPGAVNGPLTEGNAIGNSDDVILSFASITAQYINSQYKYSFETSFDYAEYGVTEGTPLKFFWFPEVFEGADETWQIESLKEYRALTTDTIETPDIGVISYLLPSLDPLNPTSTTFSIRNVTSDFAGFTQPSFFANPETGIAGPILTQPEITSPAQSGPFPPGSDFTIELTTQGTGLTYQWFEVVGNNAEILEGETATMLQLSSVSYSRTFLVRVFDHTGVSVDSQTVFIEIEDGGTRPDFSFSGVDGADYFNFYILRDGALWRTFWIEASELSQSEGGDYIWTADVDLPAGTYDWFTRSWSEENGFGDWVEEASVSHELIDLISPSDSISNATPLFEWTSSLHALPGMNFDGYYQLLIQRSGSTYLDTFLSLNGFNDSTSINLEVESLTDNVTVELPDLLPAGDYTFWVRAWNEQGGFSPWSEPLSFLFGVPVLKGPEGPQTDLTPPFIWEDASNGGPYALYIQRDGALYQYFRDGSAIVGTAQVESDDMPGGDYRFWVNTEADGSGIWVGPMDFSIGLPEPLTPAGLQNRDTVSPPFTWNGTSPDYYQIYLQRAGALVAQPYIPSTGALPETWLPDIASPDTIPAGITLELSEGQYQWWMRGYDSATASHTSWNQGPDFVMPGLSLLSPSGINSESQTPVFSWYEEGTAEWYQLYIADENGTVFFTDLLEVAGVNLSISDSIVSWDPSVHGGFATPAPPGNMPQDLTYDWYVRSYDADTTSFGQWKGPKRFGVFEDFKSVPSAGFIVGPAPAIADFNGDGFSDLIEQNSETGEIRLTYLKGISGSGSKQIGQEMLSIQLGSPGAEVVGFGDLDGDTDVDLLVRSGVTVFALFLEDGSTVVDMEPIRDASGDPVIFATQKDVIGLADFNQDGINDLAVQSSNPLRIEIHELLGTRVNSTETVTLSGLNAAVDINDDNATDFIFENLSVSFREGMLPYDEVASAAQPPAPNGSELVAVQNVVGTGAIDFIFQNSSTGELTIRQLTAELGVISETRSDYQPENVDWKVVNVGVED